jgi:Bacterial CdiA-CT RNAse A domain
MKSPLPRFESAVPRTLQAQLEIAKAIRTLLGPDQDELLRRRRAEIASLRRDFDALAREIPKALAAAAALAKAEFFAALKKYSPDQLRVPKGNPGGGEWTKEDDSRPSPGASDGNPDGPKPGVRYASLATSPDGAPTQTDALSPGFDVAAAFEREKKREKEKKAKEKEEREKADKDKTEANSTRSRSSGYPIDILEEESRGAHTVERHVGKSDDYLRRRLENESLKEASSFTTVEAANKLINATIADNKDKVARVVRGQEPRDTLELKFDSPTGYQMYKDSASSQARRRDTYWVRVVIERDVSNPRGFRLVTALPFNE